MLTLAARPAQKSREASARMAALQHSLPLDARRGGARTRAASGKLPAQRLERQAQQRSLIVKQLKPRPCGSGCHTYRVPPIVRSYDLIIGLVYCNPIPNLLNAAKWPFLFLLWPNGHSYSFCDLLGY